MRYLELEPFVKRLNAVGFMVRDYGLLESALLRPKTTVFGQDAYASFELKAAAMTHSIVKNHAMMDGNRRTAWIALNSFLFINGFSLRVTQDQIVEFSLAVATDQLDLNQIAEWIRDHMHVRH